MRKQIVLIAILTPLVGCELPKEPAQDLSSAVALDFELATPAGRPLGWYVEEAPGGALIRANNSLTASSGQSVLNVTNTADEPVVIYATVPLGSGCISELHFVAGVRTAELAQVTPVFFEAGRPPTIGEPRDAGVDWGAVELKADFGDRCMSAPAYAGWIISGSAEIDNARFFGPDEQSLRHTSNRTPSQNDLQIIRQASGSADLQGGGAALTTAFKRRVIALGESSHGAAALFELKHELIATLAARELAVVALEMPAAAADVVDDYVASRTDDRQTVLNAMVYPAWQTTQMMAVIDWLRDHNQVAAKPIVFTGFDVQQPKLAAHRLMQRWPTKVNELADLASAMADGAPIDAAITILTQLALADDAGPEQQRLIRSIRRGLLVDRDDLGGASRDFYMAEEVKEIASRHPGQILLWADNTHITKAAGSMGAELAKHFGDAYVSIGLTFGRGAYSAYGPNNPYAAEVAYAGTLEFVLSSANLGGRFFAPRDLPADHPVNGLLGFRYIGSRPQQHGQFLPLRLGEHFDVVGYVEESAATTYLVEHDF